MAKNKVNYRNPVQKAMMEEAYQIGLEAEGHKDLDARQRVELLLQRVEPEDIAAAVTVSAFRNGVYRMPRPDMAPRVAE